jgi:hypothetical protein
LLLEVAGCCLSAVVMGGVGGLQSVSVGGCPFYPCPNPTYSHRESSFKVVVKHFVGWPILRDLFGAKFSAKTSNSREI